MVSQVETMECSQQKGSCACRKLRGTLLGKELGLIPKVGGSLCCSLLLCWQGTGHKLPHLAQREDSRPQPGPQQGRKVMSPISQIGRLRPAAASSFLEWLPLDYIDFEASHFFVFIPGRTLFRLKFLPGTLLSASSGRMVRPPPC